MRKSSLFLACLALLAVLFGAAAVHAAWRRSTGSGELRNSAELVRGLGLTDLCLFTEARYTRHPSQADLHTAFQDHPLSLEHFPSGSLVTPPAFLKEHHAPLD